ncbi:glycerol-3-phosphate dehydrogenase [Plasmopara halstedii]|uniref:Glycerol-3-phosphate dehydrogenase n=1 Tax=Plasmopara halstedii TaxID=4781 RepID=A0A0P1AVA1_PLAHL|nr:glycerol-3-phosphate dehydrogenase [Plasmopara halstedii]CEG45922.1 glycerol-3-phosphate dehydrogenase [Plasmopara halstedii]|eukprot:XP_024582291.1 glycerol-3-phosphate dehydrogenase [Plasmopara halstedii]
MSSFAFRRASKRVALISAGVVSVSGFAGSSIVSAKEPHRLVAPIKCDDGSTIIPYETPSRAVQLQRLKQEHFDVLVIGGGATGSGCALDAATRGLNTAVVEAHDFAAGTSGRSTKLIHGGIRYLETAFMKLDYAAYKLVNEALEERSFFLSAAPYMNRPLPIMIPIYKWWEVPYMWVGAKAYDIVAGSKRFVPSSYYINAEEAMFQFPMLRKEGLKGAIVYYDGQMNDTRMNVSIALTATQNGATVANYVEVMHLLKDEEGKVRGAHVKDTLTGEEWNIKAHAVVNATGPFTDTIRQMDDPKKDKICVPAAGVHAVLPDHFSPTRMGLIVPKTSDGRVLFFLPWENGTLAGTTDSQSEITMLPSPTKEEVDFIIDEANRYLAKSVTRNDVKSAWSGIRPLVKDPRHSDGSTSKISREHIVEVSESNMVTIAGGKWTTYRRMAQDAIDKLIETVPEISSKALPCKTKDVGLIGADRIGEVCNKKFDKITVTLRESYNLDKDVAEHLMRNYGTRALQVAEIEQKGFLDRKHSDHPRRLHPKYPYLEAEVVFAVRQEYAQKATDILGRRMRLAFIDSSVSTEMMPRVVYMMGELLGWSKARREQEMAECKEYLATMHN